MELFVIQDSSPSMNAQRMLSNVPKGGIAAAALVLGGVGLGTFFFKNCLFNGCLSYVAVTLQSRVDTKL